MECSPKYGPICTKSLPVMYCRVMQGFYCSQNIPKDLAKKLNFWLHKAFGLHSNENTKSR